MLLNLKLNHFFRSFWSLDRTNKLSDKDLKYYDFSKITIEELDQWAKNNIKFPLSTPDDTDMLKVKDLASRLKDDFIDVSYWNTYDLDDDFYYYSNFFSKDVDSLFGDDNYMDRLLSIFTIFLPLSRPTILGVKNFRIDKIGDRLSDGIFSRIKPIDINPNWKTAKVVSFSFLSPHLNKFAIFNKKSRTNRNFEIDKMNRFDISDSSDSSDY